MLHLYLCAALLHLYLFAALLRLHLCAAYNVPFSTNINTGKIEAHVSWGNNKGKSSSHDVTGNISSQRKNKLTWWSNVFRLVSFQLLKYLPYHKTKGCNPFQIFVGSKREIANSGPCHPGAVIDSPEYKVEYVRLRTYGGVKELKK